MALRPSMAKLYNNPDVSMSYLLGIIDEAGDSFDSTIWEESADSMDRFKDAVALRKRVNVDNIDKMLRKYRRFRGHLFKGVSDQEKLVVQDLDEVYNKTTIWEETITRQKSLLELVKQLKEVSFNLNWEIQEDSESLRNSPSSSSIDSSAKDEYSFPESLQVSAKDTSSVQQYEDWMSRKASPELEHIDDEEKHLLWGYTSSGESKKSSTDSLYDIDVSSDGTPVYVKKSMLRKKYYKLHANHRGGTKGSQHELLIPRATWNSQRTTSIKLSNSSIESAIECAPLPELFNRIPKSYTKRKEERKRNRKQLWAKHLGPIIADASKEIDNIEAFLNAEPEKVNSSGKYHDRNDAKIKHSNEKKLEHISEGVTSISTISLREVRRQQSSGGSGVSSLSGKPYHIVCRDRLRKAAINDQRRIDETVRDICASQTFAVSGVRFENFVQSSTYQPDDKFDQQYKLSSKEKSRLRSLLDD